tara:strand:- start:2430 stop:2651 length:222 start_codon:yes stop_codon:yes gene_type:complete
MTYIKINLPKTFKAVDVTTGKTIIVTQPMEWAVIIDKDGKAFYATGAYENQKVHDRTDEWVKGKSFGQPVKVK